MGLLGGKASWYDPLGIFGKGKEQTVNQEAMLTAEQQQAMKTLSQLGAQDNTYDLSGFNFGMNSTEAAGGSALERLLGSGTGLDSARNAYEGILGQTFNPDDPSNEFAAFNRQLTRQTKTAGDELNREAAITGGRFGTGIQRQKADLGAQVADIQASKLAELYSQLQQNKLSAAGGLTGLAGVEEGINQGRIQAAYQYGQRQKEIQNEKANAQYMDWQRARTERLSTLSSVMNRGVDYGMKSYTTQDPSVFSQLLGAFGGFIGSKVGAGKGASSGTTTSGGVGWQGNTSGSNTPYTSSIINL